MRKGKAMKKRNIIISVLMVLAFVMTSVNPTKAQIGIFIMDDEEYANIRCNYEEVPDGGFIIPFNPEHNDTHDYFTPLGNGCLLLGCLGGAYLLGKRRKKDDE